MLRESKSDATDGSDVRSTLAHADTMPLEAAEDPPSKVDGDDSQDSIETSPVAEATINPGDEPTDGESGEQNAGDEAGEDSEGDTVAVADTGNDKADPAPKRTTRRRDRRRPSKKRRAVRVATETPQPKDEPEKLEPALALANIRSTPSGAAMALDGVFIGNTPMSDVKVSPGRHRLAFSLAGYESKVKEFVAEANKLTTIKVTLQKSPDPEDHRKTDPPKTSTDRAVASKPKPSRPRTPRVSSSREGEVSVGRSLVGSKCNSCHRKSGASNVSAGRYTRSQWTRFFAGGVHDRYDRLGGLVSTGDLAHIKAYLKSKAADVVKDQGAGVR